MLLAQTIVKSRPTSSQTHLLSSRLTPLHKIHKQSPGTSTTTRLFSQRHLLRQSKPPLPPQQPQKPTTNSNPHVPSSSFATRVNSNFERLGIRGPAKVVVIAVLAVLGTIETMFWVKVGYAKFFAGEEQDQGVEGVRERGVYSGK